MLRLRHGLILFIAAASLVLGACDGDGGGGGGDTGGGGGGDDVVDTSGGGGGDDVAGPTCGDGVMNASEACDDADLGGKTCVSEGFGGGTLSCNDDCTLNTSQCEGADSCGNGVIDDGETCDGTELGGATCASEGFDAGDLACDATCQLDTSGCTMADDCGNGVVDDDEDCDGTELDGADCASEGFDAGDLACNDDCTFDTSACTTAENCGNDALDDGEDCDGDLLGDATCETEGFDAGDLACNDDCTFDTSSCQDLENCGNDVIDDGEDCDGEVPDGSDCTTVGYDAGTLACGDDCTWDTTGCEIIPCGNGILDDDEDCDGELLGDATCETQGYDGGDLACAEDCTFDYDACTGEPNPCGNEQIDDGEDCDGDLLNDQTCEGLGYDSGTLACDAGCLFDTSNCVEAELCGNGAIDDGEDCDGDLLNDETCVGLGYDGGTLACAECAFDTSLCEGEPPCVDDEFEDNDDLANAATIGAGVYDLTLCGDEDWFTMDLVEGDLFVIEVAFTHADIDIDLDFYDATEALAAQSAGSSDIEGIYGEVTAELAGTYYMRVYPYVAGTTGSYTLSIITDAECIEQVDCGVGTYCDEGFTWTCLTGCLIDENCAEGTICDGDTGACVAGCRSDADCGDGEVCDDTTCITPDCVENADCAVGEACVDYACMATDCSVEDTCADYDLVCNTDTGVCVECLAAEDCPTDEFLCTGNVCDLQCTEDAFEPNSTMDEAATADVDTFDEVGLTLCGAQDSDYFAVTLAADMRYTFDATFTHADGDVDLRLYDAAGERVETAGSTDDNETLTFDTGADGAGAYTFEVYLFSGYTQTYDLVMGGFMVECTTDDDCDLGEVCDGETFACMATTCISDDDCAEYGLVCDETNGYCAACGEDADCGAFEVCTDNACVAGTCIDDGYEENDDADNAATLAAGTYEDLAICESEDMIDEEDWFAIEVGAGETVAVAALFSDAVGDLDMHLYMDPTEAAVDTSGSGTDDELVSYENTGDAAVTLYIRIWSFGTLGPVNNYYDLVIALDPACVEDSECDGLICEGFACIEGCRFDSDCDDGFICTDLMCVAGCNDDGDCADGDLCDVDLGECFTPDCMDNADCGLGDACVDYECVMTTCAGDDDCADYGQLCDTLAEWCVDCLGDEDCGDGFSCVLNVCEFACNDDDYEENDDLMSAVSIEAGLLEDLAICEPPGATEDDWYVVSVTTGQLLTVDLYFLHADADIDLSLRDADDEYLAGSGSSSDDEQASYLAEADMDVYIHVYSSGTGSAPYDLEVTLGTNECTEDVYEPNSAAEGADAAAITLPFSEVGLTMCGENDEEWFSFDLAADTTYRFDATFVDDDGDIDMVLYASDDTSVSLASGTTSDDNEAFEYTTDGTGGTFLLRLQLYTAGVYSHVYDLSIVVPECSVDADCGALQACMAGTCTDVECLLDEDCDAGEACRDYMCALPDMGDTCANPYMPDTFPFAQTDMDIEDFGADIGFTDSDASCTTYTTDGPDAVYAVDLLVGDVLTASVYSDFDGAIYVLSDCVPVPDDVCVAGADDTFSFATEEVTWTADVAGTYYVIVDAYSTSASGLFDVTIDVTQ